jgi:hypothetical protein
MEYIEYDSEGCEKRSSDGSDSEGSLRSFIDDSDSDELEDILESNKLYVPRVRNPPTRFADQVYESQEEETSEESSDEEG